MTDETKLEKARDFLREAPDAPMNADIFAEDVKAMRSFHIDFDMDKRATYLRFSGKPGRKVEVCWEDGEAAFVREDGNEVRFTARELGLLRKTIGLEAALTQYRRELFWLISDIANWIVNKDSHVVVWEFEWIDEKDPAAHEWLKYVMAPEKVMNQKDEIYRHIDEFARKHNWAMLGPKFASFELGEPHVGSLSKFELGRIILESSSYGDTFWTENKPFFTSFDPRKSVEDLTEDEAEAFGQAISHMRGARGSGPEEDDEIGMDSADT